MYLIGYAQSDLKPTTTSVVSESLPHLRKGAMRDFIHIMKSHYYWDPKRWSATTFTYTFETGSQIEFFGVEDEQKVRGPRRQRLFINECNNVPFDVFEQLEVRTEEFVFLDWNPSHEFWFYTDLVPSRDDVEHIILTYKDNEALHPNIVKSIEARRNRKGWWQVYGKGQLGAVEGMVFSGWGILDNVPDPAKLICYFVDFGYTNDPTAIGALYDYQGMYVATEICYRKGMSNKDIADKIQSLEKDAPVIADSAEPKSLDELRLYGLNVIGAAKGKDSVRFGLQKMQAVKISLTKKDVYALKEYRNLMWATDRNGKFLDPAQPDGARHFLDGLRYAITWVEMINGKRHKPRDISMLTQEDPLFADIGI